MSSTFETVALRLSSATALIVAFSRFLQLVHPVPKILIFILLRFEDLKILGFDGLENQVEKKADDHYTCPHNPDKCEDERHFQYFAKYDHFGQ